MRIGADRTDMDETFDPEALRGPRGVHHQIAIDRAKRGLVRTGLLPRRAQRANDRGRPDRFDHVAPIGGIGDEQFHPDTARQLRLAPGNPGQAHILAPHALRHHSRADQAGGPDEADPHRVRHC